MRKLLIRRILIGMVVGLLAAVPFSEFAFHWQGNTISHAPRTVELTIPPGTAEKVGQGKAVLPANLSFVTGDTLVVHNQDSVIHSLGPLIIPAGSSASITFSKVGNLALTCSFQPTKYLGLDINEPLTLGLRLEGIFIAGVPMGVLLTLYSLILRPIKKGTPMGAS